MIDIKIELLKQGDKTNQYTVVNIHNDGLVGIIKWHGAWRQYCFFPENDCVFSVSCLSYIVDYINKLMKDRRK